MEWSGGNEEGFQEDIRSHTVKNTLSAGVITTHMLWNNLALEWRRDQGLIDGGDELMICRYVRSQRPRPRTQTHTGKEQQHKKKP